MVKSSNYKVYKKRMAASVLFLKKGMKLNILAKKTLFLFVLLLINVLGK